MYYDNAPCQRENVIRLPELTPKRSALADPRCSSVALAAGRRWGSREAGSNCGLIASARGRIGTQIARQTSNREATVLNSTVRQRIARLPADRQERIHARAKELIAEQLTLQQLRKAWNKTRVAVARKLNVGQYTVSRYERQADLILSTLQRHVEAVDGKLSLLVEFPGHKPVKIGSFSELSVERRQRA